MRRIGNLLPEIAEPGNLQLAFWKAARGKSSCTEVVEYRANLAENLRIQREELLSGAVRVGDYHFFKIFDPKERQICAAAFRERVLHHALMNVCEPHFERRLVFDTYACRTGKGRLKAMERAQAFARRDAWYLKLDVRKYFDSVDHDVLKALLGRLFKDAVVLDVFYRIIDSYETAAGKGVPIGNLTSQHFANLYLGELDLFVKGELRVRGYVRYMDDFVLWGEDRSGLRELQGRVEGFLREVLRLELKPWQLNRVERGMPFLGCQLFPDRLRLDRRGRQRFAAKLRHMEWEYAAGRLGALELQQRAMALAAHTETCGARGFRQAVLAPRNFGAAVMDAASGTNRVLRGGNWNNNANNCRVSKRNNNNPTNSNNNNGFRCVRSSETSPGMGNGSDPAAVLSVARKRFIKTARRQKTNACPGQVARADAASKAPGGILFATSGLIAIAFWFMAMCPARGVVVNDNSTLAEASALAADVTDYPAFAATGVVQIQEGTSSYLGTGELVAPDWVLTAAHNWDTGAVTALSFSLGGQTYDAQAGQWFQDPQWVSDPNVSLSQGSDIALFHLSRAVTGVTPVTLYTGNQELNAEVTVLGAGLAGTAATGPRSNPNSILYAIRNTIDRVITLSGTGGTGGLLAFDFDDGTTAHNSLAGSAVYDTNGQAVTTIPGGIIASLPSTATALSLEGTTAPGDSGGPAFADFGNGLELIGLTSWGVNPTNPGNLYGSGYGDITYLTEVSAADEWITATIPETTVPCLVIFGFVLLFLFQQSRPRCAQ